MSRPGAGPQPLRSIPGNVFQNQQPSNTRSNTLGSSRLQNGKPGSTPSWGFGLGGAGPNLQARNNNTSSFSQAIGGGHSQTPLDLSEFPSLSGAPQNQQQSASSQAWGNASGRGPQNAPGQRGLGNNNQTSSQTIQPPSQINQHQDQQRHSDLQNDSHPSAFSQLGSLDDFRFSQTGHGQPSRTPDHQAASDEFPPLSGLGGVDIGSVRRNGADQTSHANGGANGSGFGQVSSNSRSGAYDSQQDRSNQANERMFSPVDGNARATPMSRSSLDHMDQDGVQRPDQQTGGRASRNSAQSGFPPGQLPLRPGEQQPQRYTPSNPQSAAAQAQPSVSRANDQGALSQMSDIDRWGIPGLVEMLRGGTSEDQAALALGMDLNTLGLDLLRPGNSPLYVDWPGPFAEPHARPPIPEFTLPSAYTVTNVPPLHTRISSFSDDTLFMIFYQNPRDEAQEMAAQELYKRDWRWHKKLQQWMMKAAELPQPQVDLLRNQETGWYYFWDASNWRRERREFVLNYDHLHHPMSQQQAEEAFSPRS